MSRGEPRAFIPRKRQERGARRYEAIVAAAASLFAERGLDGTSLNSIAKAAGVTIASIYQYFPNREAIVDAVAEFYLTAFRAEQLTSLASTQELSLSDLLRTGVRTVFDFYARYGGVKAFLDADPRRAPSIRTIHEEVANFAPVIGRYYPDRPYAELVRVVLAVSAIIRGSAAAIPILDSGESHAAFVDDIALASEQFIRARLGRPVEPRVSRPSSRSTAGKHSGDLR
jgi:AcrR family transcriptional regulator